MDASEVSKAEAAYFDSLVSATGEFNPFSQRGWQTLAQRFTRWAKPTRPLDVLDVGCGTGQSRIIYIKHCRSYTGIDLSEAAIGLAKQKYPESDWFVADAKHLPFRDNSFDVVAFSSVLHHIPRFVDALREGRRVLRPNGRVFAFDPNLLHPAMMLFRYPVSPLYNPKGVSPNERPLMPRELRRAFTEAGLIRLRQRCQADIQYRAVAPRLLNAFLSLYNAGDWLMARLGVDRFFGTFVLTSGRKPG